VSNEEDEEVMAATLLVLGELSIFLAIWIVVWAGAGNEFFFGILLFGLLMLGLGLVLE
jgi:hypothetical protein